MLDIFNCQPIYLFKDKIFQGVVVYIFPYCQTFLINIQQTHLLKYLQEKLEKIGPNARGHVHAFYWIESFDKINLFF